MRPDEYDIDTKHASAARVYDYCLGGEDHYAVDRRSADMADEMFPGTKAALRNNRRYLERVVRFLAAECGIRQFIDNGSGLPTKNNAHQVAQSIAPDARVVYIDNDPVVLAHQKVHALETEHTAFLLADACDVDQIMTHPDTKRLIDLGRPIALLYLSFLHFIPETVADPFDVVRRALGYLAPGSYLAISHACSDDPAVRSGFDDLAVDATGGHFGKLRKRSEIRRFFEGLDVIDPGLVDVNTWRPDGREEQQAAVLIEYGGVARKP
ncbi:MAG: SAM-dependent methyltransferase [Streptosporangiaceae bacterium]